MRWNATRAAALAARRRASPARCSCSSRPARSGSTSAARSRPTRPRAGATTSSRAAWACSPTSRSTAAARARSRAQYRRARERLGRARDLGLAHDPDHGRRRAGRGRARRVPRARSWLRALAAVRGARGDPRRAPRVAAAFAALVAAHDDVRRLPRGPADVGAARRRHRAGGCGGAPPRRRVRAVPEPPSRPAAGEAARAPGGAEPRAPGLARASALRARSHRAVAAWALVPTYPNYDAYYHLVWGRELLDGHQADVRGLRGADPAPAVPRALRAGRARSGADADRLLVLVCALCLVALVWGSTGWATAVFGTGGRACWPRCSSARASRSCSTPRGPTSTCRSWRSSCGRRRWRPSAAPRAAVMALLVLAGLLRPEAWVLGGLLLAVVLGRRRRGARLPRPARLAVVAPLRLVRSSTSGSPATRCTRCTPRATSPTSSAATAGSADGAPGRSCRSSSTPRGRRSRSRRWPAWCSRWRFGARAGGPCTCRSRCSARASLTFVATGVAGLSVLPRYLTVPAVALCLFAGYGVSASRARAGARCGGCGRGRRSRRLVVGAGRSSA